MKLGHGIALDGSVEPPHADDSLASQHAAGFADELGERLLSFDNDSSDALELLRFRQPFTTMPGFEVALRRRVERLSQFRHSSFATVRGVEYVGGGLGLVLLSVSPTGRRLSEVLQHAEDPAFATALIRQLTPALATLHDHGDGIGHGALAASRIVVTPEGRLVIVEHVLGSALERLQLTAARLYADLGIAVPPIAPSVRPRLDSSTDYFQLGLIALSLLLGRRLSSDEYPQNLVSVLDEVTPTWGRQSGAPVHGLRVWLERALQLRGRAFESSKAARDALIELPDAGAEETARQWQRLLALRASAGAPLDSSSPPGPTTEPSAMAPASPGAGVRESEGQVIDLSEPSQAVQTRTQGSSEAIASGPDVPGWTEGTHIDNPVTSSDSEKSDFSPAEQRSAPTVLGIATRSLTGWTDWLIGKPNDHMRALVVALAVCAIVEGVVIAGLLQRRWGAVPPAGIAEVKVESQDPGAMVLVDGRSVGVTPLELEISAEMRSLSVVGPSREALTSELAVGSTGEQKPQQQGRDAPVKSDVRTSGVRAAAPAPQRTGGIRLVSPIELEVFEGDRRLGSSAVGIVSAPAGRHELDLVNSVLGFRVRQFVEVKGGQVVSVAVSPPNGRININAVPWAEVWIDGKSVGETPIGNLSLPLGEHEIVLRHPELGEQRRTAVVRLDGVTRVSANLQR